MADGFQFRDLMNALIQRESRGNAAVVSNKGAVGLMQILPEDAHDLYGTSAPSVFDVGRKLGFDVMDETPATARQLLMDPEVNMALGDPYLRDLFRAFNGNVDNALTAYNAGPIAMQRALASGKGPQDMGDEASAYAGHIRKLYRDATGMELPQQIDVRGLTTPRPRPAGLLD